MASKSGERCRSLGSLVLGSGLGLVGDDVGDDVGILLLGLVDLDEIGHDLLGGSVTDFDTLHDLDLKTKDTLTELDVTDGLVNEIVLGLTSGDLVTLGVLLGLCALSTDLSGDHDLATGGTTSAHDSAEDVVGGKTDGGAGEELELKGLNVGGSGQVLVVGEGLDGELDLVVLVVEVVSLLDEGLDLLNLTLGLVEEDGAVSGTDADLGGHAGGTDLNTGVTLDSKGSGEELVELSLEHSVGNELFLGVDLLNLLVCHC